MKVEIYTAVSVDGYISGKDGYEGWILDENGSDSFDNYAKTFDAIILGGNTFRKHVDTIYPVSGTKNIVLTNQRPDQKYENDFEFTNTSPKELVSELASRGYEKIMLVGGAKVYESFLEVGLVDEILVGLHPVILGGGISLTSNLLKVIELKEVESKDAKEGFKLIRYQIVK